ncbi:MULTISPECIES: hypothetical protein [Paenibacillus]|nr:hypothetical protein [Paenibacillus lautus]
MGLYELYKEMKDSGEPVNFDNLSVDDLRIIYCDEEKTDWQIVELFNVSASKVGRIRRKHGITIKNMVFDELLMGKNEESLNINLNIKNRLLVDENIDMISKAVAHFAFRNGPIEDMHADGQLSESDMKKLNKFVHNRLAYVFQLIVQDRWLELDFLIKSRSYSGTGWDKSEPDDGDNRAILKRMLNRD